MSFPIRGRRGIRPPGPRVVTGALVVVLGFPLSLASVLAEPVVSNQNQYLVHTQLAPEGDWLAGTVDPYPLFTQLAGALVGAGGLGALRTLSWVLNMMGVFALYAMARALQPRSRRLVSAAAVTACLTTVNPLWGRIPIGSVSVYQGLAGQYTLSRFAQPASFGVLILLALPAWIRAIDRSLGSVSRSEILLATALTSLACVMHPTYLVAVAIMLLSAFVLHGRQRPLKWGLLCSGVGLSALIPSVVANPGLTSLAGGQSEELERALWRFAFERIPHHTLLPMWPKTDLLILATWVAAGVVLYRCGRGVLASWLTITVFFVVGLGVLVTVTENTTLALLFPWRVSVFLTPLSLVVLAKACAEILVQRARLAPVLVTAVAVALGCVGLFVTSKQLSPRVADPVVSLVRKAEVRGVGLIPLKHENIRLNAPAAVFVDYKSPPYAGSDLVEWWDRIDAVRDFEQDPGSACSVLEPRVDWVLLDRHRAMPPCFSGWRVGAQDAANVVLSRERPRLGSEARSVTPRPS